MGEDFKTADETMASSDKIKIQIMSLAQGSVDEKVEPFNFKQLPKSKQVEKSIVSPTEELKVEMVIKKDNVESFANDIVLEKANEAIEKKGTKKNVEHTSMIQGFSRENEEISTIKELEKSAKAMEETLKTDEPIQVQVLYLIYRVHTSIL